MSSSTFIVTPSTATTTRTLGGPDSGDPTGFIEFVGLDLAAVEARINAEMGSDVRAISELADHVLSAGGKRLRPAMVALSARAVDPGIDVERIAIVGASVEFVHMATLVHDDVVDNTATRRGKPTANSIFGNGVAVLSGDYMLARAMRLLAVDGDLDIIRTVSEITIQMSEGEVMQIAATGKADLCTEDYFTILHKKTASFVEGCCRCGAILAQACPSQESTLSEYGYRLGMAFQIADDLLDYMGEPGITGKPRGSDLRDGRATLPFLLGLASATSRQRAVLLSAFGDPNLDDDEVLACCRILADCDAFERTRSMARDHVSGAEAAILRLPPTVARDCFAALTDYVIRRDR